MKVGILADIHGNIYAFEKVLKSLKKDRLDFYIFCGDICGYYYNQNEVIEILKEMKNLICIRGNHDEMFLKILENPVLERRYSQTYGKSYSILKKNISPENLTFLQNLPQKYIIGEYGIGIFHGSPWDYLNGYIYPTDSLERFGGLPFRIILLGHTHYPMDKKIGRLRVINPGSCGQPRDYNEPSYVIFDFDSEELIFKRVTYDIKLMIQDVKRQKEENSYLTEILQRRQALCQRKY